MNYYQLLSTAHGLFVYIMQVFGVENIRQLSIMNILMGQKVILLLGKN